MHMYVYTATDLYFIKLVDTRRWTILAVVLNMCTIPFCTVSHSCINMLLKQSARVLRCILNYYSNYSKS
ncbi:unnamed protein product [Spodoptera exigua]|nr:unnamed protein product [Spodoptera exigua]